jgi:hypothetical protein
MKNICFALGMSILIAAPALQAANPLYGSSISMIDPWVKSKGSVWVGQYNIKYKIDKKGKVSSCKNGKTWLPAKDGVWLDHLGKRMKMEGKVVKWSGDDGKTWSETPGGKWQGGDGKWYKIDKQYIVWAS